MFFSLVFEKAFGNRSHLMLITCTWRLDPRPAAHGDNKSHWNKNMVEKKKNNLSKCIVGILRMYVYIYIIYIYIYYVYVHAIDVEMVVRW